MLTLSNGHAFDFCCAAGALGFDGRGWWWEQPLRWLGLLRPREFTVISKTLTALPRRGNYDPWRPWRCVRLAEGGAVNAMGLPNMGVRDWVRDWYPRAAAAGLDLIVSVRPGSPAEAAAMGGALDPLAVRGVELNLSCPNTGGEGEGDYDPAGVAAAFRAHSRHPLIAKLGSAGLRTLLPALEPYVEAFDLINTVPWDDLFPGRPSPLAAYGLGGGVSGAPIRRKAREALALATWLTATPVISGGGIDSAAECAVRLRMGAAALSLGTVFLRTPWRPNRIARAVRRARPATPG